MREAFAMKILALIAAAIALLFLGCYLQMHFAMP